MQQRVFKVGFITDAFSVPQDEVIDSSLADVPQHPDHFEEERFTYCGVAGFIKWKGVSP